MLQKLFIGCIVLLSLSCKRNASRKALIESAPLISQTYQDDRGREITLAQEPQRVVSIAPNITEIIYAIGAQDKLIARSQACDFPQQVQDKPLITTYPQLDLESLTSLQADLVFSTSEIFTDDDIVLLEEVGIPIYLQKYSTLDDVYEGMLDLGTILSVESRATLITDSLKIIEKRVISLTEDLPKYNTMILVSADPLKVVGGNGFLNELINKAGGKNIFADKEQAYSTTTLEEIIYLQPEFIIFPTSDIQQLQAILSQYPALTKTPAYESRQVFTISPDWMYRPGPRMIRGLLELTHILHSSLTPDNILSNE